MMSLYDAWSRGHRWVEYRGRICRLSCPQGLNGRLLVSARGGHLKLAWVALLPMKELCRPIDPNSKEFRVKMRS